MKIISCFSALSEISPLIGAGADELYCAVGHLPAFGAGSLPGLRSLEAAITKVHALGKKLHLAVNAMHVTRTAGGLRRLQAGLLEADAAGIDGFIAASPSVLMLLKTPGKPFKAGIHLSSVQPCFNSAAARYFIRLGVSRLILPSQLYPLEAGGILKECRRAGVLTEIFDYRFFGCGYMSGRCNLHDPVFHTFRRRTCSAPLCRCGTGNGGLSAIKSLHVSPRRSGEVPELARRVARRVTGGGPPRLGTAAAFFDFFRLGVDYLKYGTRLDPSEVKIKKVAELRAMLNLAEDLSCKTEPDAARAAFIQRLSAWNRPAGGGGTP